MINYSLLKNLPNFCYVESSENRNRKFRQFRNWFLREKLKWKLCIECWVKRKLGVWKTVCCYTSSPHFWVFIDRLNFKALSIINWNWVWGVSIFKLISRWNWKELAMVFRDSNRFEIASMTHQERTVLNFKL